MRFKCDDGVAIDRARLDFIEESPHFLRREEIGNVVGHRVVHAAEGKTRDLAIDEGRSARVAKIDRCINLYAHARLARHADVR
ncbi:MAG: hypothetical protein ACK56F_10000, partial [bacterium]